VTTAIPTLTPRPDWLSCFQGLSQITDPIWFDAVRAAKEVTIPPGTLVLRKGDACQNFLFLVQGTVRVYEITESGREIVLYRVRAGEMCILTITNLLEQTAYSASAITEDEVRVISIPMQYFQSAMEHSQNFRTFIMSSLARRLSDVMRLVEQVTFQRLDLRLACLLGQLFGQRNVSHLSVTHQQLASDLGTTREVVSRLLKEFERMGCIRLSRGQIELVSEDALARLSSEA